MRYNDPDEVRVGDIVRYVDSSEGFLDAIVCRIEKKHFGNKIFIIAKPRLEINSMPGGDPMPAVKLEYMPVLGKEFVQSYKLYDAGPNGEIDNRDTFALQQRLVTKGTPFETLKDRNKEEEFDFNSVITNQMIGVEEDEDEV